MEEMCSFLFKEKQNKMKYLVKSASSAAPTSVINPEKQ